MLLARTHPEVALYLDMADCQRIDKTEESSELGPITVWSCLRGATKTPEIFRFQVADDRAKHLGGDLCSTLISEAAFVNYANRLVKGLPAAPAGLCRQAMAPFMSDLVLASACIAEAHRFHAVDGAAHRGLQESIDSLRAGFDAWSIAQCSAPEIDVTIRRIGSSDAQFWRIPFALRLQLRDDLLGQALSHLPSICRSIGLAASPLGPEWYHLESISDGRQHALLRVLDEEGLVGGHKVLEGLPALAQRLYLQTA
jgi:hypothetical protein